ncbi:hypothetical protein [Allonocardiopsis opalescens]|uniref:Uncharacterized protein n=1 Tax=Allonocardiopsis opalescens TaxID=1144618 RepID=A0A2T0PPL1_9ACTN|nr:hypothetical protein [Allonocardiopsis opalescens]PRX90840.1 hypothetical protein CLV72_11636 [Allonocardiopsis opalescens]
MSALSNYIALCALCASLALVHRDWQVLVWIIAAAWWASHAEEYRSQAIAGIRR